MRLLSTWRGTRATLVCAAPQHIPHCTHKQCVAYLCKRICRRSEREEDARPAALSRPAAPEQEERPHCRLAQQYQRLQVPLLRSPMLVHLSYACWQPQVCLPALTSRSRHTWLFSHTCCPVPGSPVILVPHTDNSRLLLRQVRAVVRRAHGGHALLHAAL